MGLEKVSQNVFDDDAIAAHRQVPDCKESFDIGNEDDAVLTNIWPPEDAILGFRGFFAAFFETCHDVEERLLRMIAVGMGIDEDYFLAYHRDKQNQIRLLHYPSVEDARLEKGEIDCIGAHSDFGTITLLFQDEVGGLEVEDLHVKGQFNPAPYIPGTIVVNIGDFLMRWSNDELRSTLHHVRTPAMEEVDPNTKVRMTKERFSIPYFIAADRDKVIDCVPGCYGEGKPRKYKPINCADYLDMRLNATY